MAGERDVLAAALAKAEDLGSELVNDHRGIPYDVIERVDEIAALLRAAPSPEPLPREALDVERLASEVSALVSPEMVARRAEPYAQGYINAINYVLGIIALSPDRPTPP